MLKIFIHSESSNKIGTENQKKSINQSGRKPLEEKMS